MIARVGVVSDTHGLVRRELLDALRGVDHIVHAGDIGTAEVLDALGAIAPVTAVRGNNDRGTLGAMLPLREIIEIGPTLLYLTHDADDVDLDPAAAGVGVVVTGHTHRPSIEWRAGVLHLNPGSAGPRRFSLPVSCARIEIGGGAPHAEVVTLIR